MIPNITHGAKMTGLVMYLAGPGRANEHTNPHVVAASSEAMTFAGRNGAQLDHDAALDLASELDTARIVFGTPVVRTDKKQLAAAQERGLTGSTALAEATHDENVWHCSLSLSPEESADIGGLSDEKWATIAREFMAEMGFDSPTDAPARWAAIHHGATKQGGDHIHIVASRIRDDGAVVKLWFPEPGETRNTGDLRRSQRVAADLEQRHGLLITAGRAERYTTKGVNPAQDNIATRTGRPEPVKTTLARNVRAISGAAESEAEFVRLVRAHGMLIRPRYATGSRTEVTGYSVALGTDTYATKTGEPVWHGGGKLGNDLSLPRLRETWIDDDGARADAVSAWSHNRREPIAAAAPGTQPEPVITPKRAQPRNRVTFEQARDTLRDKVLAAAQASRTESDFVGIAFSDPDLLIRPRFAKGSTTEVTGYSVALRPHLYARADGQPQWHGGGKLDPQLSLSSLRERWEPGNPAYIEGQWTRAAGHRTPRTDQWGPAAAAAGRWSERVNSVAPDASMTSWAAAGADTAATVSAWAMRAEAGKPAELARLADALAATSGEKRAGGDRRGASAARRAAAMILAASHDDPMQAYRVMFAQIAAASRAIAAAAEARGHAQRAVAIRSALDDATRKHTAELVATVQQGRAPVAARSEPTRRPEAGRDTDYGR